MLNQVFVIPQQRNRDSEPRSAFLPSVGESVGIVPCRTRIYLCLTHFSRAKFTSVLRR